MKYTSKSATNITWVLSAPQGQLTSIATIYLKNLLWNKIFMALFVFTCSHWPSSSSLCSSRWSFCWLHTFKWDWKSCCSLTKIKSLSCFSGVFSRHLFTAFHPRFFFLHVIYEQYPTDSWRSGGRICSVEHGWCISWFISIHISFQIYSAS